MANFRFGHILEIPDNEVLFPTENNQKFKRNCSNAGQAPPSPAHPLLGSSRNDSLLCDDLKKRFEGDLCCTDLPWNHRSLYPVTLATVRDWRTEILMPFSLQQLGQKYAVILDNVGETRIVVTLLL